IVVALAMVGVSYLVARLFGLQKPSAVKDQPYECGMTPVGGARVRFTVKFYLVAKLFILFGVEALCLYPSEGVQRGRGLFGRWCTGGWACAGWWRWWSSS